MQFFFMKIFLEKFLGSDYIHENKTFFWKEKLISKFWDFVWIFFKKIKNILKKTEYFNTRYVFYNVKIQHNLKQNWQKKKRLGLPPFFGGLDQAQPSRARPGLVYPRPIKNGCQWGGFKVKKGEQPCLARGRELLEGFLVVEWRSFTVGGWRMRRKNLEKKMIFCQFCTMISWCSGHKIHLYL